ncbi:hypothetical protein MTO96_041617 [Rhipicephalus appendiculatus]
MNSFLDERLRGLMSSYPSKYQTSGGPWVSYFPKDKAGGRFANLDGFVGGRDSGRGNTGYMALPAGPGANTGYTTNNPPYHFDGPDRYPSRSASRIHSSGYLSTNYNNGLKGYLPFFPSRSTSDSSDSSRNNSPWNPRGAWQGIG